MVISPQYCGKQFNLIDVRCTYIPSYMDICQLAVGGYTHLASNDFSYLKRTEEYEVLLDINQLYVPYNIQQISA